MSVASSPLALGRPLLTGVLRDESASLALGRALGQAAQPGQCVALEGGLGAGKTTLGRGLALGFGLVDAQEYASPTYTYLHPYRGARGDILHFDFYRVGDEESAYALGLVDALERQDALLIIEWASLCAAVVPGHALWLQLVRQPPASAPVAGEDTTRQWQAAGGPQNLLAALAPFAGQP